MSIIDLQEIAPNSWKASYRGNYGTYKIKIKTDGQKAVDFSCSCPSDYYPCKHIPIVVDAIRNRIKKCSKKDNKYEITLEQLLKDVSADELRDFVIKQAQNNPQLKNAFFLKFANTANQKNVKVSSVTNPYTQILQSALNEFDVAPDYDNSYYDEYLIEIDVLDQWYDKAEEYVNAHNPVEAILICKACIEEFADWYEHEDIEIEYIDSIYMEKPFEILKQTLSMPGTDCKELFDYCKSEIVKPKYKHAGMDRYFDRLFMELSLIIGSNDFILRQDELLQNIDDKSSNKAEEILQRKIDFYQKKQQHDDAWNIIRENLQIESFRRKLTEKFIAEGKFKEAKGLINEFISTNEDSRWLLASWHELKLQIAQKENDVPEIRRISFSFIKTAFNDKYYKIYKSAFTKKEWPEKAENLIKHYQKSYGNRFCSSIADVLNAEKQSERLMKYIAQNLSINNLESYYTGFSSHFPEKTLDMFRLAIDKYAQDTTGQKYYEHIADLFKKMTRIKGGKTVVKDMISQYLVLYKRRKNMVEIMKKFEASL